MKMFRKLVSIVAAATVLTSSLAFSFSAGAAQVDDTAAVASEPNLQDNPADGVILHAFNWSYNSIKQNLPQIKAAGYSTVQTSPVTQPKNYGMSSDVANQWWKLYQPVSLSIAKSSWLGDRDDLKALCDEADKYGIKIIVDIVANHMANNVSAAGADLPNELGPEVKTYEPQLYGSYSTYFHTETYDASDSSAETMTRGHVSACPDLNTANSTVQQKILALLKDCIDCGVDGFRFDAAKHIETESDGSVYSSFWANTLDQAKTYYKGKTGKDLFAYGEILNTLGGRNVGAYTKRMRVTENKYSDQILAGVNSGNTSSASATNYQLSGSANSAVVWAESHDTFMGESGSAGLRNTSGVTDEKIVKAWAIVAARQGSVPLYFARPGSSLMGEAASDLTYKSTVVSEINKFHNAFASTSSEKVGTSGSFVYVARGNAGVVLANINGNATTASVSGTGLADGSYVDTVTGNTFTVSGGTLSGNVGSTGVAVVYKSTATPKATASVESGNFTTDTMTVQLGLENAVSGTYALEDSTPVSFTGTPTIRIGSDYNVGETITLNLTATDAAGTTTTSTYYYTKKNPTTSGIYVFLKPSIANGWTNVSCFVYDEDTTGKKTVYSNGGWPGQAMTYDSKLGYYYIEIPAACVEQDAATGTVKESTFNLPKSPNTYVIFNGTKNNVTTQYPGANVSANQKLKLGGGTSNRVLDAANASGWKNTTMTPTIEEVQATNVTKGQDTPIIITTEPEPTTTEPPQPVTQFVQKGIYGDVNEDGVVNISDITVIQRELAEFEPRLAGNRLKAADVDQDGAVSIKDVTYIQMFLAEYASGYAHTNEPYGEVEVVDPSGDTFTVTAKSNLFATNSTKLAAETNTFTVTYFAKSEKSFLSGDWMLTYDSKALEPVSRQQFMPKVAGATYNTAKAGTVTGNASVLSLVPMQTESGAQVPLVSATFRVLKPQNTTVELSVKDLVFSKLNSGESTSKAANETDIVENSEARKPDCAYTLYTSVYAGSLNETYNAANDPKVAYDPNGSSTSGSDTTVPVPSSDPVPVPSTRTIIFSDNKGWGSVNVHYWGGASDTEWPGVAMTQIGTNTYGEAQFSAEVPTDITGMVFNGPTGQTTDVEYNNTATGWYCLDETDGEGHYLTDSWISDAPITNPTNPVPLPDDTNTIEFTDNLGWGKAYIYIWNEGGEYAAWPGFGMNSKGDNGYGGINYTYEVPADATGIIFTNGEKQQTVDIQYTPGAVTGYYPTNFSHTDDYGNSVYNVDSWSESGGGGGGGTVGDTRTILFTDNKGWGSVNVHYWGGHETEWPGVAMTPAGTNDYGQAQFNADVPTDIDGMVFNGPGGQTVDVVYDNSTTGWYPLDTQDGEGKYQVGSWGGNSSGGGGGTATGSFYLVGYINGADVSGTDYAFNNGTLTMNFSEDSYVCIRDSAGNWFMANGYPGEGVTTTTLYSTDITGEKSDKLWAPAGSVTFTLTANSDGTYTLTEGEGGNTPTPGPGTTVLFTNNNGWGTVYVYGWNDEGAEPFGQFPGTAMTSAGTNEMGQAQFSATVPAGTTYLIFSDGGFSQTVDITYDTSVTGYYLTGTQDGTGNYEVDSWTSSDPVNPPIPDSGTTVLFTNNNGWGTVYVYGWNDEGAEPFGQFPGTAMTSAGTNDMGQAQFSATVPAGTTYLIFSDGGFSQTVDITYDTGVTGYYLTGTQDGMGNYEVDSWTAGQGGGEQPTTGGGESSSTTVLFSNNHFWSSVSCYAWDDNGTEYLGAFSGSAMTKVGTNDYGEDQYSIEVPAGATYVIFSGGGEQTVNVTLDRSVTGYYISGGSGTACTVGSW